MVWSDLLPTLVPSLGLMGLCTASCMNQWCFCPPVTLGSLFLKEGSKSSRAPRSSDLNNSVTQIYFTFFKDNILEGIRVLFLKQEVLLNCLFIKCKILLTRRGIGMELTGPQWNLEGRSANRRASESLHASVVYLHNGANCLTCRIVNRVNQGNMRHSENYIHY